MRSYIVAYAELRGGLWVRTWQFETSLASARKLARALSADSRRFSHVTLARTRESYFAPGA